MERLSTSTDTKGRQQPAKKKRRTEDDFRRDLQAKKAAAIATAEPRAAVSILAIAQAAPGSPSRSAACARRVNSDVDRTVGDVISAAYWSR